VGFGRADLEFEKRHLKTSEKTARKNARGDNPNTIPTPAEPPRKKAKYTPFPPPQQPSKLDLQLASGEYFLKPQDREAIEKRKKVEKQNAVAVERRAMREEAFIPPPERLYKI
jgi:ribosomal RNA assembly protein